MVSHDDRSVIDVSNDGIERFNALRAMANERAALHDSAGVPPRGRDPPKHEGPSAFAQAYSHGMGGGPSSRPPMLSHRGEGSQPVGMLGVPISSPTQAPATYKIDTPEPKKKFHLRGSYNRASSEPTKPAEPPVLRSPWPYGKPRWPATGAPEPAPAPATDDFNLFTDDPVPTRRSPDQHFPLGPSFAR